MNAATENPSTAFSRLVPLALLQPSPTNPRRRMPQATIATLADSIAEHELMQPILARPNPGAASGAPLYEIVAGERRWRACSLLQDEGRNPHDGCIPCMVREISDTQVLAMQLVENVHRDDLHPLDEAEHYRRMRDDPTAPYSVDAIAHVAKVSPSRVYERLSLLALEPAARDAFEAGGLTLKTALMVARMPAPLQAEATSHLQDWGGEPMGPKAAAAFLRDRYMLRLAQAPFAPADADLLPAAGACTGCPKRSGANPQLFGDITDADTCTDPTCFNAKKAAQRERLVDELRVTGYTVLQDDAARDACAADGRNLKPGLHPLESMVPYELGEASLKVLEVVERAATANEHIRVVDHPGSPTMHYAVPTQVLETALRRIKAHRSQLDKAKPAPKPAAPPASAPPATKQQTLAELDSQGWTRPAAPAGGQDAGGPVDNQALLRELLPFKPPPTQGGLYDGETMARYEAAKRRRARAIITAARVASHMQRSGAQGLPSRGLAPMIIVVLLWGDMYLTLADVARLCGVEPGPGGKEDKSPLRTRGWLATHTAWAQVLPEEAANRVAMAMLALQETSGDDGFADFAARTAAVLDMDVDDVDDMAAASVAECMAAAPPAADTKPTTKRNSKPATKKAASAAADTTTPPEGQA